ncbi:transcriptional repressor NF-X1-like [Mytilus californianus]|uniref:transcriptional repressor NF-X1-like n=1 Tax=Mytilus californianus TaxID=6549 RepID=UPI0022476FB2|nr:transcriptional repressor NF-X1-like [Mytilus californianus]XP_052094610.1 transcriptional repressor NF-X1-like [Mytilus californianus]
MADGYKSYGEDYSQYFYYDQQYPPQFYYQYDPQNYNHGIDNSQNFYQGGGNPQPYYYQGGENQQNFYCQGPAERENPHTLGMNERPGKSQNLRGRGASRGKLPGSRGRGKQQFNAEENQSMDKRHQSRPHFHEPIPESKERTDSNDSKENFPYSNRNKNYSENTRSRGRGRGQQYNSRQFYRHNTDREGNSDNYDQYYKGDRRRGDRYSMEDDRGDSKQSETRNEYVREGYTHQRDEESSKKDTGIVYEKSRNSNDNSNGRQRTNERRESNWKDKNRQYSGGGKSSPRLVEMDKNRQFSGGRKSSPRLVEMDSKASFERRNNPQQSSLTDDKYQEDSARVTEKKYKFPPADKKFISKKQMIKKVLAGKVDETQRGLLIEQLTLGSYECMVCCETVKCHHAVWNCPGCFHAFHLICIKKWARSPTALMEGEGSGWRCPACQKVTDKFPNQYLCFCGKIRDPQWDRMETPHSCGQVCGKSRGDNCSHQCNILCHPGPCPPCNAVVNRNCACGKESKSVKCSITDVMKCDTICGRVLNCGKHFCKASCHGGSCEPCEEIIIKECYGSHEKKEVKCGCIESFSKSFSCGNPCKKSLECGHHECDMVCHAGDCKTCETLPEVVTNCPCGATPLSDLSTEIRTSCTDPIPTCAQICNKPLGCGSPENVHKCQEKCHEGPCGPCDDVTTLRCRCDSLDKDIPCKEVHQFTEEKPFTCERRCNKKRSCGRHKCGQLCCVSEEHFCILICGRKLSCELHKCDEPCHRGNCPPCLMTSYDELTCHCGAEVMLPPIPCGTKPPECKNLCSRQHDCDHTVYHYCHSEEECPPCTVLTEKRCMGNHELRKNIPCHQNNVSCGLPCNKVLPCQQHKCLKTCHSGDCQKDGDSCNQPCRIKRKDCNHMCGVPCHFGSPCPQTPCKAEVLLICKCGNKEAKVPCLSGAAQDTAEYQKLTVQSLAGSLHSGQPVDISQLAKKKLKRQLDCDAECAVLERNRRMALALEIRNPDLNAKLGNPIYTDFLKDYAKQNPHFVSSIEKALSELVKNAKQSKQLHRSNSFSPGNRDQRRAIHELAECYGCETQSYDYEPKKNVVATAYRDKCWLPSVTLTSYIQRELHPKAPLPIPHVHSEAALKQTAKAAKQSTDVLSDIKPPSRWETKTDFKKQKPEIDYFDFSSN